MAPEVRQFSLPDGADYTEVLKNTTMIWMKMARMTTMIWIRIRMAKTVELNFHFLSDTGVPGVRSLGPVLSHKLSYLVQT